jgi:tRNA dimethylallyltransferase
LAGAERRPAGGGGTEPPLRVICGPTAAGKSPLALALAERHGAAIVSADSRQVYRGFDVGTAKPTAAERARVPHYGVDVAEPTVRYSAADWAEGAERWIADARARGLEPLVVGGTGFYLRALFAPLFVAPALEPERRAALERLLAPLPVPELRRWCERLDPPRAHLGRSQLLRSIETALLTGARLSDLHRTEARAPRHTARYLVVDPGEPLARRIAERVVAMLDAGWVEECLALEAWVPPDAPAWNATGYGVVRRLAAGELSRAEAERLVTIETRQYAKRQRTWFRHQLAGADVTRVSPDDPGCERAVEAWWTGTGERSVA